MFNNYVKWSVILVGTFAATANADDLTGYLLTDTSNSVLYLANFSTGGLTPTGPSGKANIRSLAVRSSDGALFATTSSELLTINTTTGAASVVEDNWGADEINFVGSRIYGIRNENRIVWYDPNSGQSDALPQFGVLTSVKAFTVDPQGGGIGWDNGSNFLFCADIADGTAQNLGLLQGPHGQIDAFKYGPDGELYGLNGSGRLLWRIDVDARTTTLVGEPGITGSGFSFFSTVPEPSVATLAIAAAVVALHTGSRGNRQRMAL